MTNNNSIVTFEEAVKLKIKNIITELIPEDRWDNIVRDTISSFEKVDLPIMIKKELTDIYKEKIRAELYKPEWQAIWNNGNAEASEALKQLIIKVAPDILAGLLGSTLQQAIEQFKYALNR